MPGEIARYRRLSRPIWPIVTNAGSGHLEGFGSVDGVVREKLSADRRVSLAVVGTTPPGHSLRVRQHGGRHECSGRTHRCRRGHRAGGTSCRMDGHGL